MSYVASTITKLSANWTPEQLGYLAGILDGEGTFIHNAGGGSGVNAGVRVCMTDKCVIDWLRSLFAGVVNQHPARSNRKEAFAWTLARQADVRLILEAITPLLIVKKEQAKAMIELLDHLANKPNQSPCPGSPKKRAERRIQRLQWNRKRQELREKIRDAR